MLPVISLQVLSGWCHISSAAPAAVYVCGRKKKSLFVGLALIFFPPPLPQSSASISSGVERIRPPPADPQHTPISAPVPPLQRPPVSTGGQVELLLLGKLHSKLQSGTNLQARRKQAIDESHWVLCRDPVSSAAGLVQRCEKHSEVVDLIIAHNQDANSEALVLHRGQNIAPPHFYGGPEWTNGLNVTQQLHTDLHFKVIISKYVINITIFVWM